MSRRLLVLAAVAAFGGLTAAEEPPPESPQVVRTFVLDNVAPAEVELVLSSVLGLETARAVEDLGIVVVRGPDVQVAAAADLIRILDRPRAEVEVDVELLFLADEKRSAVTEGAALPQRLSAAELERLREVAPSFVEPRLAVLDRSAASLHLREELAVSAVPDAAAMLELGLDLTLRPQVHAASDEVTLAVTVAVFDVDKGEPDGPRTVGLAVSGRAMESIVRVRPGETLLLSGWLRTGDGGWLAPLLLGDAADVAGEIVLALSPRVVRGRGFSESDLEMLCSGGDETIELCKKNAMEKP